MSVIPVVGTVRNVIRSGGHALDGLTQVDEILGPDVVDELSLMNMLTTLLSLLSEKNISLEISDRSSDDRNSCWRLIRP